MKTGEMFATFKQTASTLWAKSEGLNPYIESTRGYIIDNFGESGLYAAYLALAAVSLLLLFKLLKLTITAAKYLVLPSLALALAGSFVLPLSFSALLPVTVSLCSVVLLVKG